VGHKGEVCRARGEKGKDGGSLRRIREGSSSRQWVAPGRRGRLCKVVVPIGGSLRGHGEVGGSARESCRWSQPVKGSYSARPSSSSSLALVYCFSVFHVLEKDHGVVVDSALVDLMGGIRVPGMDAIT
ncbi:hypothetical protein Dimus_011653, partial [Dionaea muscipula]